MIKPIVSFLHCSLYRFPFIDPKTFAVQRFTFWPSYP